MILIKRILCTGMIFSFCSTAFATTVNVRQEFRSESGESTRLKLSNNIGNFIVGAELKLKPVDGTDRKTNQNNGWELALDYRFKLNENWSIVPGMPIEAREKGMTYKPQVRINYGFNNIEGLVLSGRYRYDIIRNNSDDNKTRHRLTSGISYKKNDWRFGFDADFYKAVDYNIYDNSDTNYELNFTMSKKMGQWTPSIELGDTNVSSDSSERELRTRIGVSYSF